MKAIIDKVKNTRINIEEIIVAFLILQPFFDIYMGVVGERFDIFGVSLVTIIRILFFVFFCAYTFIKLLIRKGDKDVVILKSTILYLLLVVVYLILHHVNIRYMGGFFYNNGFYSIIQELIYISRLIFPILLVIVINSFSEIKVKSIVRAIVVVAFIITAIIVITNIFKVSFAAYVNDENVFIEKNIFKWFTLDYSKENVKLLTSKGFFKYANQISNLLLIILPIVVFFTIKRKKWYNYFILLIDILAMIMIGSKIAAIGWFPVYIVTVLAIFIISLINKTKVLVKEDVFLLVTIGIMCFIVMLYSPVLYRQTYKSIEGVYAEQVLVDSSVGEFDLIKSLIDDNENLERYINDIFLHKEEYFYDFDVNEFKNYYNSKNYDKLRNIVLCEYVAENYPKHRLASVYVEEIYNFEDNPEFWLDVFELDLKIKSNYRELKKIIAEQIKKDNNNYILDSLFGFGATTLLNKGYMLESDIISHYYYFGVFGTILFILPYLCILIFSAYKMLRKLIKEKIVNILSVILYFSTAIAFLVAVFSGYTFDDYIVSIFLASIVGILLKRILNKESVE